MSRLAAIDLVFLLLENQMRPTHMASGLILQPPAGEEETFVSRLLQALRSAEPGKPFNQKLKWLGDGVASWEPAQADPLYHVRHLAIPRPGTRVSSSCSLVPMGQPGATITDRLQQIHDSTAKVKDKARNMSAAGRQTHLMLLLGLTTLPEMIPGVNAAPSSNVLISNMAGPAEQLYLGGAALRGMFGLPILPPTPCLNITFVSLMGNICVGIASTPESMSNPRHYVELLQASFAELKQALLPTPAANKRSPRKKATPGKAVSRKSARKKAAPKKTAPEKAARKKA